MKIEILGFDWDESNLKKLEKHGVTQGEAEEVFYQAPLIDEGAFEKKGEKRYRCLGITLQGRLLAAFFTIRKRLIRNISARPMRKKERQSYEKQKSD